VYQEIENTPDEEFANKNPFEELDLGRGGGMGGNDPDDDDPEDDPDEGGKKTSVAK
jgi:hypothetical protein